MGSLLSEAFLNWEHFEDVIHNSNHSIQRIYLRLGIMISHSFKGNKKNIFEYMHPSIPGGAPIPSLGIDCETDPKSGGGD